MALQWIAMARARVLAAWQQTLGGSLAAGPIKRSDEAADLVRDSLYGEAEPRAEASSRRDGWQFRRQNADSEAWQPESWTAGELD